MKFFACVMLVICGYLACSLFGRRNRKQLFDNLEELHRWRVNAEEARRWLAEFPDVAIALDHVQRCAAGVENPEFIADVRERMRVRYQRRMEFLAPAYVPYVDVPSPAASACVAARTEDEFRVAYQHLSAECCSDDTPSKPSRWDGAMRGL